MRLPGFTAEGSLYRNQGYKTVYAPWPGVGSPRIHAQVIQGPGGPPGTVSICQIFPWLCVPPVDPCAHCGTNPACHCTCMGGYWNGYYCT